MSGQKRDVEVVAFTQRTQESPVYPLVFSLACMLKNCLPGPLFFVFASLS